MVEMDSVCCPDHEINKETRGALGILSENGARAKMQEGRNEEFLCVAAATRVGKWQKIAFILSV